MKCYKNEKTEPNLTQRVGIGAKVVRKGHLFFGTHDIVNIQSYPACILSPHRYTTSWETSHAKFTPNRVYRLYGRRRIIKYEILARQQICIEKDVHTLLTKSERRNF